MIQREPAHESVNDNATAERSAIDMRRLLASLFTVLFILAALAPVQALRIIASASAGEVESDQDTSDKPAGSDDAAENEESITVGSIGGTGNPVNPFLNPDPTAKTLFAKIVTTTGTLNMRQDANTKAKVLTRLASGSIVRVVAIITETESKWTHVIYKDKNGYVMTKYLEFITELPYKPIKSGDKGDNVLAFKQAMRRLGYIKSVDVNTRYDAAMETALTKLQLMNNLPINPSVVSAETQALMDWGYLTKYRSGYLTSATDETSGLSVSIFVWDVSGTLYDYEEAVNVKLSYGAQAFGGQPPYTISVKKSTSVGAEASATPATNPFYHMWTKNSDRLYVYATVTDAIGNTVTACAPYKYTLPPQYDGRFGWLPHMMRGPVM
jgi:uncharacterized protein YgiM (DUF1202 family)